MKTIKQILQHLKQANAVVLLLCALFLALFLELFFFNARFFYRLPGGYERTELDLSSLDGYNGEALPLLPENPSVSFDQLSLPVRSVTVHTAGPRQLVSGTVGICDEANAWRTAAAGRFQANPGGREASFTVRLQSRGALSRLRITLDEAPKEPVFLLSVVLNEIPALALHPLRLMGMAVLFFCLFCILRYRLYAQDYRPEQKSHRLMNLGVLAFCLLVSCGILYGGSPDHTLLKPYPSLEEVRSPEMVVDAYMQQLDAFEKGQIALDLDVNPALDGLDNPYDKGERDKKEISYHWDRAYYRGNYYSYFGLAPLFTVYYPVYWLTGMLPTELLAGSLLALFAVLAVFMAVRGLLLLFRPRANLLLLLAGEAAVICGSFLYLMQASMNFYYLPLLSAVGWLAAFTALACSACLAERPIRRILLFALDGCAFVMLVLSRPNMALLAVAFAAPLFLGILLEKGAAPAKKLQSALPFLIPVLIGGAAILYYNQIRFGFPFEFGTAYQLTESDIRYNRLTFSLHHFGSMLYHYFGEPFVYQEFFPFLRFTTEKCADFGNYLYQEYSAGLFQMPINLGLLLFCLPLSSRGKENTRKKQVCLLVLLGILALGYVNFLLGGIHIRYVCDLSLTAALLSLFLILEHVHFDGTKSARILYTAVFFLLLVTIGRGMLTIFSNETNGILHQNPDFYLWAGRMFQG